ncbi:MAG: UvrD-helicase domain-containing protein [Deltaproteobacteria bacterium]|nr:UvrD-helicase domain-containing protein [Deltaproteobacteria bacterium]
MSLADDDARALARDVSRPLALVAGAGAGKTSVLVDRVRGALLLHPPQAIAAVTFTEKAAAEIGARVRAPLAGGPGATSAIPELSLMTITTLHGFARRLLLEEAFAAGFPPAADVAVGGAAAADERAVVDAALAVFVRQLRRADRGLWRVLDALVTPHALRQVVAVLLQAPGFTLDRFDTSGSLEASAVALKERLGAIEHAAQACTLLDDKLLLAWRALAQQLHEAAAGGDVDLVVWALVRDRLALARNIGTKKAWPEGTKERLHAAVADLVQWQQDTRTLAHGALLKRLADDVVPALALERQRRGLVSFDDLLLSARDLLRDDVNARARLGLRFSVVLIDEVQDTDPLQAEITSLLCVEGGTRNLFVVGDPKQAIYRFRGGDVEAFMATAKLVDDRASLSSNFRSVPGVVSWCNHTFQTLPGFEPQQAVRAPGPLAPVVVLDLEGSEDEDVDVAGGIADHVQGLIAAGSIVARDVMVVLPSWAAADDIADAFSARGIPAVIEGGDRLFSRDEMRLALATLRAIVDGSDTEAVAFCLRGVFGSTLTELWDHQHRGQSFRPHAIDAKATPTPSRVDRALDRLARATRRMGSTSLARLVEDVLWDSALPAWSRFHDADRRRANLDRFFALVEAHEQQLRSPLEVVQALINEATREDHTDVPRLDDDGTAARITTLFSAKGLEAPVVVVAAFHRRRDGVTAVLDRLQRTASIRLGKLEPPGWADARARDARLDDEERRRWVYVACTRARDQLVLAPPFHHLLDVDVRARGLPADLKDVADGASVPCAGGGPLVQVSRPSSSSSAALTPVWITAPPVPTARPSIVQAVRSARSRSRRWQTVSEVVQNRRVAVDVVVEDGLGHSGSVGAVGGRLVHAVMERLDFTLPIEMRVVAARGLCQRLARAGFTDTDRDVVDRACSVVERLARHPVVDRVAAVLARHGRVWREVPFAVPSADRRSTTAGTIDLVFVEEPAQRVVVVDWKSDVPPPGTALRARYEAQLQEYVRAVVKGLPGLAIEAVLAGPHRELPVDDEAALSLLTPEVRGVVEGLGIELPAVGLIVDDIETVCAWPERRVALSDAPLKDDWRSTDDVDALPALLGLLDEPSPGS